MAVSASGTFTFPTPLISGDSYSVVVASQPNLPTQTCVATANDGTVADGNVTTVVITCASQSNSAGSEVMDTVGGTAVGVLGSGLVLQDDGGDNLSVPANGSFTFKTPLAQGQPYAVTVLTPPINPYQDCAITGGSGTTGTSNISNVQVSCKTNASPAFTIGGTVTGVSSAGAVVLQDNGRDNLTITADGPFTFPIAIPSGSSYSVTSASISGQQSETCAFANASGIVAASNVANVTVTCRTNVPVSVTVSGLTGSGLVLQDNGTDNLAVSSNGKATFATALPSGNPYSITVATPPQNPTQNCKVANGTGVVEAGTTTNITVSCTTDSFSLGGTVTGVTGTLVLQINGGNNVTVNANGAFTFPTTLPSDTSYSVTVLSEPALPSETCAVANGTGIVGAANVNNIAVTCAINYFTVGGTISGLTGTGLVIQDNGGNNLAVAPGTASFTTAPVVSGATFAVTVLTQPAGQICSVTNGSGTVGASNVTNVALSCISQYSVGGNVSGLLTDATTGNTIAGLSLRDNAGAALAITTNGTFTFPALTPSGGTYTVTIASEPSGYACAVANGSGTVTTAAITTVSVSCSQIGGFLYVTNGAGGNISGFAIDANSGTLQPLTQVVATPPAANAIVASTGGGSSPSSIVEGCVASPTANYLYVANAGSSSISAFTANVNTAFVNGVGPGVPQPITLNAPANNPTSTLPVQAPSFLDFSPYYCDVLALGTLQAPSDGTASLFSTGLQTGALAANGSVFNAGTKPLAAANTYLINTYPTTSSIFVEYIADAATGYINEFEYSGGVLTPQTLPNGPVSTGTNPDAVAIVQPYGFDSTAYVYVANYGTGAAPGSISEYTADPSSGNLMPIMNPTTGAPVVANTGNGPSALAQVTFTGNLDGDDIFASYLYVANRNDATVDSYMVYPSENDSSTGTGSLIPITPVSATPTGTGPVAMSVATLPNPNYPSNSIYTTVSYMYVVNSGSNSVSGYSIDPTNGGLTPLATSPFAVGSTPTSAVTVELFTVGGSISGLTGSGLVLENDAGTSLAVPPGGTTFTFSKTPYTSGTSFNVTVLSQPAGQTCSVTNGTGTVGTGNVTSVSINCGNNSYTVGGTITGVEGNGLVLQDNDGDNLNVPPGSTAFTFATPLASGTTYAVSVQTAPTNEICIVTNGTGTVTTANVTNVSIACGSPPIQ